MTVRVLWVLLNVPWVGLQRVIVVIPDHTHLLVCVSYNHLNCIMGQTNGIVSICQYINGTSNIYMAVVVT